MSLVCPSDVAFMSSDAALMSLWSRMYVACMSLMSLWSCFDVPLLPLWCHFDVSWCRFDVALISLWYRFDVALMSLWCVPGMPLPCVTVLWFKCSTPIAKFLGWGRRLDNYFTCHVSLCDGPRLVLLSFGLVAPTCFIYFGPRLVLFFWPRPVFEFSA